MNTYTIQYWLEVDDCADFEVIEIEAKNSEVALETAEREISLGKHFSILDFKTK